MPSSSFAFLLFPLLLLPLATCNHQSPVVTSSPPPSNGTTVYDLLPQYGLPPGLLPDTVTSFTFSEDDGQFVVNLSGPCYVEFEYLVYYEPQITGVVRYGIVSQLKGIQVRRFLVWFNVDAIKVDLPSSEYIYFDVGWITKKLSADQFMTIHSCRSNGLIDVVTNATTSWFSV
ncbi:hypothetical protein LUZ61_002553 [Rhynchospora tenuis]|uniref:Uncharacterized protein n=1 Tax=Rhynchospora tenuis TaxID=198213 RepID=A0AAD6ERT0_9POAL|nr:hypothetical protein LUZ61_002553 [Rhynchospora tenuis]